MTTGAHAARWVPIIDGKRWDERRHWRGEGGENESGESDPQCTELDRAVMEREPAMGIEEAARRYRAMHACGSTRAGLTCWELRATLAGSWREDERAKWETGMRGLADADDPRTMACLARRAEVGLGIETNIDEARGWYERVAGVAGVGDPWARERVLGLTARTASAALRAEAIASLTACVNADREIDTARLLAEVLWGGGEGEWDAAIGLIGWCRRTGRAPRDTELWLAWSEQRYGITATAHGWLARLGEGDGPTGYVVAGRVLRNYTSDGLGAEEAGQIAARIACQALANEKMRTPET